jgi:hypothetical protein
LILEDHKLPANGHSATSFLANGNGVNGNGTHHSTDWQSSASQPEQPT